MVLKKSNSGLNSGATQRVGRGGLACNTQRPMIMENVLAISVPPMKPRDEKLEENVSKCLEKIWNYIQWEGPGLPQIQCSKCEGSVFYSMNKARRWLLPATLDTMMSDMDFLQEVNDNVNVAVIQIKDIPNGTSYRPAMLDKKYSWKIQAESTQECEKNQEKRSRKRFTYHERGVQRLHHYLRKHSIKEAKPGDRSLPESVKAEININVYLPYHVDARSAYNFNYEHRFCHFGNLHYSKKSFFKTKGYVNGLKEYFKGYTKADMKEDMIETLTELRGECEEYIDYCDKGYYYFFQAYFKGRKKDVAREFDISDLIVDSKQKTKRRKKKKQRLDLKMLYKDWLNHAEISEVVAEKDWMSEYNLKQRSTENLQDDQLNNSFEIISSEEAAYGLDMEQTNNSHSLADEFNSGNVQFDSSFVNVDMVEETLFSCDNELDQQQLRGSGVVDVCLGNSYPPCFVVKFSGENDETKEWYLVGKKSGQPNSSWLISIQCQDNLEINAKFRQRMSEQLGCRLAFQNLIYLVSALKYDLSEPVCLTTNKKLGHTTSSNFIWQLLPQTRTISTHTITDAVSLLQQKPENKGNPEQLFLTSLIKTKAEVIQTSDCTTCFLPYKPDNPALMLSCGHAFCVSCWRTHLYYNNRHGTSYLPCMITGCSCQMDLVTLKSILPFSVVTKWSNQARDNLIDSNPKCNWCPEKDCQNFAISTSFPLKTQFGFPVSCGCSHTWCGNCQKTPHWPTSCDQMSAYNKLLEKTGARLLYGQALYHVKLKHCPKCKTPIEKNYDRCYSPYLSCGVCTFNFCWECLRDTETHTGTFLECTNKAKRLTNYTLSNILISDLPIKYFTTCLEMHKFSSNIKQLEKWLQSILQMKAAAVKFPTSVLSVNDSTIMLELTKSLAEESFYFLENVSTFMEMFYVLLSFAAVDKRKFCKITAVTLHKMSRLEFINKRLENYVMGKTLPQISKSVRSIEILLKAGKSVVSELVQLVQLLQNITKDVNAETIGDLDPIKYLRYK